MGRSPGTDAANSPLAFNRLQVADRVGALLHTDPPGSGPRRRLAVAGAAVACLAIVAVAAVTVIDATLALDALMHAARPSSG